VATLATNRAPPTTPTIVRVMRRVMGAQPRR
jgi:hypothetical protein